MPRNQQSDQAGSGPPSQDGGPAPEPAGPLGQHGSETALLQLFWAIGAAIERADPPEISRKNLIAVLRGGRLGYDQLIDYLRRHEVLTRAGLDPLALTESHISTAVRRINEWFGSRRAGVSQGEKPFRHHEPVRLSEQGKRDWMLVQETLAHSDGLKKSLVALTENLGYNDSIFANQLIRDLLGGFSGVGDQQQEADSAPGFRERLRPDQDSGELAARYEAVYARMRADRQALLAELGSEFAPVFDAKVRQKLAQDKPQSVEERAAFVEWIAEQLSGLGLVLFDPAKHKSAYFQVLGTGEYRLVPTGGTSGQKSKDFNAFLPLRLAIDGPHKWSKVEALRQALPPDEGTGRVG